MSDDNRIERALDRAFAEHERVIFEPPRGYYVNRAGELLKLSRGEYYPATLEQSAPHTGGEIIKYIEDGAEWSLNDHPYTNSADLKKGGFSWCGAFQAWCDIGLSSEIRRRVMLSTYRLYEFCKKTARDIPLDEIQRGDLVIVGRPSGKRWGAHITRAVEVTATHVHTIEGNGHGLLGDGKWGEGVVTRKRPFKGYEGDRESVIMHAYRFLDSDYEG